MPTHATLSVNIHDLFFLSPAIVLTVWGLLVLLVDLGLARRLGSAARRTLIGRLSLLGVGIALFVDEMQDVPAEDVSALCAACHELSQTGGPLIVVGAGLPHLPSVLSASKSYSERLFRYTRIDRLDREAADLALIAPALREDVTFTTGALDALYAAADGYPYFVQAYGKVTWDVAAASPADVERAIVAARDSFDAGTWADVPAAERAAVVRALIDHIETAHAPLVATMVAEAERIAVDERVFVGPWAVADQVRHVEPVEIPVLEPGQEFVQLRCAVIVFAAPLIGRRHVTFGNPVDLVFARCVRRLRDRIADEFQGFMPGRDHGAAGQERIRRRDAAPQDAPVPDRRAFPGIEFFAHRRVDAVRRDQERAFM